jgi:hypothetical protein
MRKPVNVDSISQNVGFLSSELAAFALDRPEYFPAL